MSVREELPCLHTQDVGPPTHGGYSPPCLSPGPRPPGGSRQTMVKSFLERIDGRSHLRPVPGGSVAGGDTQASRGCPCPGDDVAGETGPAQTLVAPANAAVRVMSHLVSAAEEGHVMTPNCAPGLPKTSPSLARGQVWGRSCFVPGLEIPSLHRQEKPWAGGSSRAAEEAGAGQGPPRCPCSQQAVTAPAGTQRVTVPVTAPRTPPAQCHQLAGKQLGLGRGPEAVSTDRQGLRVRGGGLDLSTGGVCNTQHLRAGVEIELLLSSKLLHFTSPHFTLPQRSCQCQPGLPEQVLESLGLGLWLRGSPCSFASLLQLQHPKPEAVVGGQVALSTSKGQRFPKETPSPQCLLVMPQLQPCPWETKFSREKRGSQTFKPDTEHTPAEQLSVHPRVHLQSGAHPGPGSSNPEPPALRSRDLQRGHHGATPAGAGTRQEVSAGAQGTRQHL